MILYKLLLTLVFINSSVIACDISTYNPEDLKILHNKFIESPNVKSAHAFFESIPSKFCAFNKLYGYENSGEESKLGVLYHVPLYKSLPVLRKFVSEEKLVSKYTNLASEGRWYADNVGAMQSQYYNIFKSNPKIVIKSIMELSNEKQKAATKFLFDGPHPSNSILKENEKLKICKMDKLFCTLLTKSEQELLEMEHCH